MIDILIPTLWRADRLAGLVANIRDVTVLPYLVTFIIEDDDDDSLAALEAIDDPQVRYVVNTHTPNCAGAFQSGFDAVQEPQWFAASDDIVFWWQWDTLTMAKMGESPRPGIVGTNDLGHPAMRTGKFATQFLVDTDYTVTQGLTLDDQPGVVAYQGYGHDYFDTEASTVAVMRGVFRPCLEAIVEHRHLFWGKASDDATYRRNRELAEGDGELFQRRYATWLARHPELCAA